MSQELLHLATYGQSPIARVATMLALLGRVGS